MTKEQTKKRSLKCTLIKITHNPIGSATPYAEGLRTVRSLSFWYVIYNCDVATVKHLLIACAYVSSWLSLSLSSERCFCQSLKVATRKLRTCMVLFAVNGWLKEVGLFFFVWGRRCYSFCCKVESVTKRSVLSIDHMQQHRACILSEWFTLSSRNMWRRHICALLAQSGRTTIFSL